MYLFHIIVLLAVWSVHCYKPNQQGVAGSRPTNSKKVDEVKPARYTVKSGINYEPNVQDAIMDFFPEVDYPSSIVDSSKPFYLNASPFSDDVQSAFNSLVSRGNKPTNKPAPKKDDNEKLHIKSEKISDKEVLITVTKGSKLEQNNSSNSNSNNTNDTSTNASPIALEEEDIKYGHEDEPTEDLCFTNFSEDHVIPNRKEEFVSQSSSVMFDKNESISILNSSSLENNGTAIPEFEAVELKDTHHNVQSNTSEFQKDLNSFAFGGYESNVDDIDSLEEKDTHSDFASPAIEESEPKNATERSPLEDSDMHGDYCSLATVLNETCIE